MAANWQRGVMRLMRIKNHAVEVTSVQDLTPWYRRITFTAPELVSTLEPFPTFWLRLWVPGRTEGSLVQRGYTFVRIDQVTGTFDLDFVLHEIEGPAGDWAKAAQSGDRVEVALTPAKISVPDGTTTILFAGDTTALPAINSWLSVLPDDVRALVYLAESHADRSELPLDRRINTTVRWVDESEDGSILAGVVSGASVDPSATYAWAAGEKNLIKAIRPVFEGLGLEKQRRFSQFYWIRGKATG